MTDWIEWWQKIADCRTLNGAKALLEELLDSNDLIDYMRDTQCDGCEERMPDEPQYNEGYLD